MGLAEFLSSFKGLHDQAKAGKLDGSQLGEYDRDRDELAIALMSAQKEAAPPGVPPRLALKVPKAIQVELSLPAQRIRAMTVELSARSFSTLLADAPPPGTRAKCAFKVPNSEPIECDAVVVDAKRQPHNMRVNFKLDAVAAKDSDKLAFVVFDEVISKLSPKR